MPFDNIMAAVILPKKMCLTIHILFCDVYVYFLSLWIYFSFFSPLRCPLKKQNYDYAMYLLTVLYFESWVSFR